MSLTSEQVHLFRHNGFLKLENRLPGEQVEKLKKTILRNFREEVQPVVRDREGRVVRISGVVDREPVFFETASSPLVLDPLESLLGPNIELIKNRHNHATLRLASENRPEGLHRDVRQWSRTIFTVIFYLQETNGGKTDARWSCPAPTTSLASAAVYTTKLGHELSWARPCPCPCPKAACSSSTA